MSKMKTEESIKYVVMAVRRWDECELTGLPKGSFGGSGDGSIGFMPVFDDIDKLKAAYPDGADIMKITAKDASE